VIGEAHVLAATLAFHGQRPSLVASWARRAGFDGLEVLCEPPWYPRAWSEQERAALVSETRGMLVTLHAPIADVNLMSPHPGARAAAEAELVATLRLAADLGAESVTFHLGYRPLLGAPHDPPWEEAQRAVRRLADGARRLGIALCLENDPLLPGAYLADLRRLDAMLRELELPGTLDVGHAWTAHGPAMAELVASLLPRLRTVHVHDNDGKGDEHLALGKGDVDLESIWSSMEQIPVWVVECLDPTALRESYARLQCLHAARTA